MSRFAVLAAWPLAVLVAVISSAGLVSSPYAREAPAWAAQAIGQDWFDLVVVVPWLALCGLGARRGARWRVLLAGSYAYVLYELFIYAFAIHFNALFLVYCATLGLAGYALVAIALDLARAPITVRGTRIGGGFLVSLGVLFALLWLAEDVPAMLRGASSRQLAESGLLTNPVHVIDFAFVLPAHVIAGVLAWRRGGLFGAVVLAFGALMATSIGGMMLVMQLTGAPSAPPVMVAMFGIGAASATVLARMLASGCTSASGSGATSAAFRRSPAT